MPDRLCLGNLPRCNLFVLDMRPEPRQPNTNLNRTICAYLAVPTESYTTASLTALVKSAFHVSVDSFKGSPTLPYNLQELVLEGYMR